MKPEEQKLISEETFEYVLTKNMLHAGDVATRWESVDKIVAEAFKAGFEVAKKYYKPA